MVRDDRPMSRRTVLPPREAAGFWTGAVALLLFAGLQIVDSGRTSSPPASPADTTVPIAPWRGIDLERLLGPLTTLEGAVVEPEWSGLRLWILVADRECPVCLGELPSLIDLAGDLDPAGDLSVMTVALGDRCEARRTLLGIAPGMEMAVTATFPVAAARERFGATRTPLRLLTWHGRVVERSLLSLLEPSGEAHLREMVRRWSDR
jgi:hypothetical protein